MTLRSWLTVALLVSGACKQESAFTAARTGAAEVAPPLGSAGSAAAVRGSAGSGEVVATAVDPWVGGPPPGSDIKLGEKCGHKLNKIDPWAGAPTPPKRLEQKVEVAQIEQPVADRVELKDLGGGTSGGFKVTY
ncbi:MAG: hypothetical protein H0X17_13390, partial [Deltaproteobacteria bacterium]|nr:hypothetical protein [Deltaproteobacteria bacterium]